MSFRGHRIARLCLRSSQVAAALGLLSPLLHRVGLTSPLVALGVLALAVLVCLVVLVAAPLTWLVHRRPEVSRPARTALVVSVAVVGLPAWTVLTNLGAPPIHHITTDPEAPPEFVTVVSLRGNTANPLEYPGDDVWAMQTEAYPDVRPLMLAAPPADVFAEALQVVERFGWERVAVSEDAGRIEATDTTGWFAFKDDVVVRIRPENGGTRVDLRSVSRVGQGDLGANAARIKAFIKQLESEIGS